MTLLIRFGELPSYLRIAWVCAFLFILCHIIVLSLLFYWQIFDPSNLTFKAWFKTPVHLNLFENTRIAVALFAGLLLAQLIGLVLYLSWMFQQGKRIYYLAFGMVLVGIWTYFLLPGLILLGLMLPEASLHHFGVLSFEDLF